MLQLIIPQLICLATLLKLLYLLLSLGFALVPRLFTGLMKEYIQKDIFFLVFFHELPRKNDTKVENKPYRPLKKGILPVDFGLVLRIKTCRQIINEGLGFFAVAASGHY